MSYFGSATLPRVGKSSWLLTFGADFLPRLPYDLDEPLDDVTADVSFMALRIAGGTYLPDVFGVSLTGSAT
jgi:hypothetical protein